MTFLKKLKSKKVNINMQHPLIERDALFYTLDSAPKSFEKAKYREIRETRLFKPTSATMRNQISLPKAMANWNCATYEYDTQQLLDDHFSDLTIEKGMASVIPDIMGTGAAPMVSAKAKKLLEKIDPEYSLFIPFEVTERPDGARVGDGWFYWLIKKRISFKRPPNFDMSRLHKTNSRFGSDVQWELLNVPAVRKYLSTMPFWRQSLPGHVAIRKDIFIMMKEAGLTGLVESQKSASIIGREEEATIGHLI